MWEVILILCALGTIGVYGIVFICSFIIFPICEFVSERRRKRKMDEMMKDFMEKGATREEAFLRANEIYWFHNDPGPRF